MLHNFSYKFSLKAFQDKYRKISFLQQITKKSEQDVRINLWNNPPNVYDFLLLAHDQETIIKEHLNTRRKIGIEFLSGISTTD